MPLKAITSAPSTPASTGREFIGCPTLGCRAVDRNTVLWTMVVFFGSALMFSAIRSAAEDDGVGVALVAQIVAGGLLIAFIVLYMRSRGD
jgi:threonine/homoserine efflux transporter RhtA